MTSVDPLWRMECVPNPAKYLTGDQFPFNRLEIFVSLAEVKQSFDNVERWTKPESAPFSFHSLTTPKIRKEAKGVVVILVPYNFPILLLMSPIASGIGHPR